MQRGEMTAAEISQSAEADLNIVTVAIKNKQAETSFVTLRNSVPEDDKQLTNLAVTAHAYAGATRKIHQAFLLHFPQARFRVAIGADRRMIGYNCYVETQHSFRVAGIAVTEDQFGNGLGQHLLDDLLGSAGKLKKNRVYLEVARNNDRAIRFYIKNQFKKCGRHRAYYPNGQDAVIMERFLNGKTQTPSKRRQKQRLQEQPKSASAPKNNHKS